MLIDVILSNTHTILILLLRTNQQTKYLPNKYTGNLQSQDSRNVILENNDKIV
jgi:hypothetical protein